MRRARRAAALPVAAIAITTVAAAAAALAGCASTPPAASEQPALSGTVMVLAAASLTETFDALAAAFEAEHARVDVVLSYGGSSALAEQLRSGGLPADVFAAANESTMQQVTTAELADDPKIFATNVLTLAVPRGNPGQLTGLGDLARADLAIALCDREVPCGAATEELLERAGVTALPDTLDPDVRSVLTRVRLGEADAGLVYATDVAAANGAVEAIAVPEAERVVNRYPIVALHDAPNPAAAAAFVAFVLGPDGLAELAAAGFGAP